MAPVLLFRRYGCFLFKGCQFFPAIFCAIRTYLWQNGPEDRSEGLSFARALVRNHTKEKNFMSSAILLLSKLLGEGSLLKLLLFLLKFAK